MTNNERPVIQRAARLPRQLPAGEVEIPDPEPRLSPPASGVLYQLLPAVFMLLGMGVVAYFSFSTGAGLPLIGIVVASVLFAGGGAVVSWLVYRSQKRAFVQDSAVREQKYTALLGERRVDLARLHELQRSALREREPSSDICAQLAERRALRLWERAPADPDFLSIRLGTGERPSSVLVRAPRQTSAVDPDPLVTAAQELAAQAARVAGAPMSISLEATGVLGIAGPRAMAIAAVHSMLVQLATHHAPDEVKIVVVYPFEESDTWAWVRWLPHTWSEDGRDRYLACEPELARGLLQRLHDELAPRRLAAADHALSPSRPPVPRYVFVFAEPQLVEGAPLLPSLLREDAALGAHTLLLAADRRALPQGCRAVLELGPSGGQLLVPATPAVDFQPDLASADLGERCARAMAPLRIKQLASPARLPAQVTLFDVLGVDNASAIPAFDNWQHAEPFRSLSAPIGLGMGGEPVELDIHQSADGPHGLVAGATGWGKSELLQALIASLAVRFHPHELTFVLVDYKGGSTANAFADLPHLIGTLTNLEGGLAIRALMALTAELERRERLLASAGVNDVDAYQMLVRQHRVSEPIPHLVVVVDEFAELKAEHPDFIRELVRASRKGRSLAVHLILATQQPSGVVDDQIWANSRFRICLHVERAADSRDVLRRPDAVGLTVRGRAYLQVGEGDVLDVVQVAWGGAPYATNSAATPEPVQIAEVLLDGHRRPLARAASRQVQSTDDGSQLQAVVAHLRSVAATHGLRKVPSPWLPPLPREITLGDVRPDQGWDGRRWQPHSGWLEPVIGLVDNPAAQRQDVLRASLWRGHLAVYGAPGSGKTSLLQTLVMSLALDHSPEDVNVYVLDFAGRLLTGLAGLPHVGGVVLPDEEERITRLLQHLDSELRRRKEAFAESDTATLAAYRQATKQRLPAIVLLVDNYPALAETYPAADEAIIALSQQGANLGVHVVVTATAPPLRPRMANAITQALALQLAEAMYYSDIVGYGPRPDPPPLPGRGLCRDNVPLEFQTALAAPGAGEAERGAALRTQVQQLADAWQGHQAAPWRIRTLSNETPLGEVLAVAGQAPAAGLCVPIGLNVDDLEPCVVDLCDGPHLLVTGPPRSGLSTCLKSLALGLATRYPPERVRLYLSDFDRGSLGAMTGLAHVRMAIHDDADMVAALHEIDAMGSVQPDVVVVVDDFAALLSTVSSETLDRLDQLARQRRDQGVHLAIAATAGDLQPAFSGLGLTMKAWQTGFVLGTSDYNDLQLLGLPSTGGPARTLPPGRGFFGLRRRATAVQIAIPNLPRQAPPARSTRRS